MINDSEGSQNGGQLGPVAGAIGMMTKQQEDSIQRPQYSMPGILHFLQTEWSRFEMERSQWEVERAELQARIAFLQGERKGQENLKQDLVRRIKMLEYALKQERSKYHKLKYGTEINQEDLKPPTFDKKEDEPIENEITTQNSNVSWRQGRHLLRQYLQEIGYTDTIIDVRSARVRSLLGLQSQNTENEAEGAQPALVNGDLSPAKRNTDQSKARPAGKKVPASLVDDIFMESEKSVLATLDFLDNEGIDDEDDDDDDDDVDNDEEDIMAADEKREVRRIVKRPNAGAVDGIMAGDEETEEALREFDFLVAENEDGAGETRSHGDGPEWEKKDDEWKVDQQHISKLKEQYEKERKGKKSRPKRSALQAMLANLGNEDDVHAGAASSGQSRSPSSSASSGSNMPEIDEMGVQGGGPMTFSSTGNQRQMMNAEEDALEVALGLGELAGLTPQDESDPVNNNYDNISPKEPYRKTWNAKYTLRSHFDGVRALAFHPVEPVLLTASEDHTLKLWNLQKTVPAKKAASLDVEPVYTFRAHIGAVLCLAINASGEQCYSGGLDSTIKCWNIPNSNIDPYDSFDPSVLQETLTGHTDAVWGLSIHSSKTQLLSNSSDGTVKLWSPGAKSPLLNTFTADTDDGVPTSVDFIRCDPSQMVASYTSSNTYIYDLETAKQIICLETKVNIDPSSSNQINRIITHPTLPITITAHEDRHIRFFDNNTGKMIHSMVAHLDAVTSLAIDPNGLYLLSGSHDCSIRLWNWDSKTCVQEITAHRKKFDESIFDVAFHPSKPYIASAGADALAKVFV